MSSTCSWSALQAFGGGLLRGVLCRWVIQAYGEPRADNIVERGRRLVGLFKEVGVPSDKYLLRIPATWQGIQAAKVLESEGVATHLILIYRCSPQRPSERHTPHARALPSKRHSRGCTLRCSRCMRWPQQRAGCICEL